jgi:hypothetical protein
MYPGIDGEEYNRNISVAKGECKKRENQISWLK